MGGAGDSVCPAVLGQGIEGGGILVIDLLQTFRHVLLDVVRDVLRPSGLNHVRDHLGAVHREHVRQILGTRQGQAQLRVIVPRIAAQQSGLHLQAQLLLGQPRHGIVVDVVPGGVPPGVLVKLLRDGDGQHLAAAAAGLFPCVRDAALLFRTGVLTGILAVLRRGTALLAAAPLAGFPAAAAACAQKHCRAQQQT